MAKVKITLKKSVIGSDQTVRDTARSLGLKKTQQTVIQEDSPCLRGKIRKLEHLLAVEEVAE